MMLLWLVLGSLVPPAGPSPVAWAKDAHRAASAQTCAAPQDPMSAGLAGVKAAAREVTATVDPALTLESCTAPRSLETADLIRVKSIIGHRKAQVAYPSVASVYQEHLPRVAPQPIEPTRDVSPGLSDPMIEEARRVKAFEDFKPLSDVRRRKLSARDLAAVLARATEAGEAAAKAHQVPPKGTGLAGATSESPALACRKAFLHEYIDGVYTFGNELEPLDGIVSPKWKLKPRTSADASLVGAFDYTEETLAKLVRKTPEHSDGSLLPNPYPFAIPAGRFQEAYYWDSYFGMMGLLATGRLELSQMQVDNFLEAVRNFGFIPNGMRDYYLSRSQPPFLSSMVRDVYEASLAAAGSARDPAAEKARIRSWLRDRAYPLMERDYQDFWMNPRTRYDATTGLNHHWDEFNLPRPERHASDVETRLGRTYRDVRAEAESGLDFTVAFGGEASRVAGVLLNSMLYKTEGDLAWAARELGKDREARKFEAAARRRRHAMDRYLWDPAKGVYENYDLRTRRRIPVLSATAFAPLYVHAASARQAGDLRARALPVLEKKGGLMSSDALSSTDQWDGPNGWAPLQVMAVQGLRNYGYDEDARRISDKWVRIIANVESRVGAMYERMDVARGDQPYADGTKYPPQQGFLWTNSSFVWMLKNVLGYQFEPLH